ncbi:class I SAM-dependent methyltransferase [Salinactinospora qingdaonensis]|uniref:Class I SAM-dependent methyltransferase n=1 Tax=Salinactinospora qingdaonensis TaxID=702744 RepID=A0ABP7FGD8_9ACTN
MAAPATKSYRGIRFAKLTVRWYASLANRNSHEYHEQARQVAERAPRGSELLEVASGPGLLAILLAGTGDYTVTAVELSDDFVATARRAAAEAGAPVDFRQADASALPFPDASFDFVACCNAIKNFAAPVSALREMHRVLRPGGGAFVSDLRPDLSRRALNHEGKQMGMGPLARACSSAVLRYYAHRLSYSRSDLERMVAASPFTLHNSWDSPLFVTVELRK